MAPRLLIPLAMLMMAAASTAGASTLAARATSTPPCRDLSVSLLPGGVATGHSLTVVVLRNASSRACHVSGYARLTLYGAGGAVMASRTHRGAHMLPAIPRRIVTLRPGARASFDLEITSVDGTQPCQMASRLRVRAPGAQAVSAPFPAWISPCENGVSPLTISSIHAGTPHVLKTQP